MSSEVIPKENMGKKGQYLKFATIAVLLFCVVSLMLPWLSFGVNTERGTINLRTMGLQVPDASDEKMYYQMLEEDDGIDEYIADLPAVKKIRKQLISIESGTLGVIKTIEDSKLTPIETAMLFTNGGKALSQAAALAETARSGMSMLDLDIVSDILDYLGLSIQKEFSGLVTGAKLLAFIYWLVIAAIIAVSIYNIYALATNRRSVVWVETIVYGILLLGYCVFSFAMNQVISAQLTDYIDVVGKSIRPFHIVLWPVLAFVCLAGCLAAELAHPNHGTVKKENVWVCTCGRKNSLEDQFCSGCGHQRKDRGTEKHAWTCVCGHENDETDHFCGFCGRKRNSETVEEPSRLKIKMRNTAKSDTGSKGFQKPDNLD